MSTRGRSLAELVEAASAGGTHDRVPLGDGADARQAVILRYARLRDGEPVSCGGNGDRRRVIYRDRDAARKAVCELEALGARDLVAVPCPRSRHGHYHLRSARLVADLLAGKP